MASMTVLEERSSATADNSAARADGIDHDPAELIAQLGNRIVLLQRQAQALGRFPGNKDGKQQRHLLQQQIRTLYQQVFLLEQRHAQARQRSENYLSVALSMAAHAAHARSNDALL